MIVPGGQFGQHMHRGHIEKGAGRKEHRNSGRINRIQCLLLFLANAEISENGE